MAQDDLQRSGPSNTNIMPILYRPFDTRFTYFTGRSRGFLCYPRAEVMGHMLAGESVALMACRQQARGDDESAQVFATSRITESCAISNITREINYLFPLYLYPEVGKAGGSLFNRWTKGKDGRTPNLASEFVEQIAAAIELRFGSDGRGDLRETFGAEDVFSYIYTVFHSSGYRGRYGATLKLDFPRVPIPGSVDLFRNIADVGHDLLALHLLESPTLGKPITS